MVVIFNDITRKRQSVTDKVVNLKQYQQELHKQAETLSKYQNDGTVMSMMIESHVRLTELIGNLTDIITIQQDTINDLAQHVNNLRKRGVK